MKNFFILCIVFVVCWARPDVSHITKNEYFTPEQTSSLKYYAPANASRARVKNIQTPFSLPHAQIESIRPSIHIASFSLRTIVPLEQLQQTQSIPAPTQQSFYSPKISQASSVPTQIFYNNNAPSTYQQSAVQQSYTPPFQSSLQMQHFLPRTPIQQYHAPQTQHPTNVQGLQSSFVPKMPVQQTYSPSAAVQQNYLSPTSLQQVERQPPVQQTYLPPIPAQQAEIQTPVQQAQSFKSSTPVQQRYTTVQQEPIRPAEKLQQSLPPRLSVPANVRQAEAQQNYLPPTSAYQDFTPPVPIQKSYVPQQSKQQPIQPSYTSSSFDSTRFSEAYLPPAPIQQTYAAQTPSQLPPIHHESTIQQATPQQNVQQTPSTPATFTTQQVYSTPSPLQQVYMPQQSYSQQSYSPLTQEQQTYSASAYLPPIPLQSPRTIQQFRSPSEAIQSAFATTHKEPQTQATVGQPISPAVSEVLYNTPTVQPNEQHFIATKTAQQTHKPYNTPEMFRSPPKESYIPSSIQQAASAAPVPYRDNNPVDLREANAAPVPQSRPTADSINNSFNYMPPSEGHSFEAASSASGTQLHTQNQPSPAPQQRTQEEYIGAAKEMFRFPPKQNYTPTSIQQAASGSYRDNSQVDIREINAVPAPQHMTTGDSVNNSYNYMPQQESHSVGGASGTESHIQNQLSQIPATHNNFPAQTTSDIGTYNHKTPVVQSIQKAIQTTELHTSTASTSQQAPNLNSPAVSSYNYQPSTAPVEMFNFIPKSWIQPQVEYNNRPLEAQQTLKNTEDQHRSVSINQGATEPRESTMIIAEQPTQKTELSYNPNAGTEYASDGGYIYRRN